MIFKDTCPVCGNVQVAKVLSAKDFTVSGKLFDIWECKNCTARFTQNIPDEKEIGAYYQSENYISHSDTTEGLVNNIYHKVRKFTLTGKRKLIQHKTGKKVGKLLDIGSGTGAFLHTMKETGWEVRGLEPDESARKKSQALYHIHSSHPKELFTLTDTFDAITLWHVLEHVHDLHQYMDRINQLLKPGGKVFIAVPNYTSYDAEVFKEFWAAYDVPRHLYHFSPTSMKHLFGQHQFSVHSIKPMWFDSFYVSMLSKEYQTGHSKLISAGITGAISNIHSLLHPEKCSSVIYIGEKK